jgi:hypothetical protein
MTATAPLTSSVVFSRLLVFLQNKATSDTIKSYLTGAGVPDTVADMIAQAITTGGTVSLPSPQSIQLGQLLQPLLPSKVSVPTMWADSTLTVLSFDADVNNQQLALSGSLTVPLTLASFSTTLTLNLAMSISGATFTASLTGSLPLAKSEFTANCDLTQDGQTLSLTWTAADGEQLQLEDLCSDFNVSWPKLPDGLPDLHLTEASATVDLSQTADTFEMTADSAYPGEAFIIVDKPDGGDWRLAFGIALAADISAFSPIGDFSDLDVTLTAAELLVATDEFPDFEWPESAGDQASLFESFPFDLAQGVAIFAILDLSSAADQTLAGNLQALSKRNSQNTAKLLLSAQLQDHLADTLITASLGNCDIYGYDIALSLSIGLPLLVSASGSLTFTKWNDLKAIVTLGITDEMVEGTVAVSKDDAPYALIKLGDLKINELGGLMGIDFDKEEVVLGFVGQFTLGAVSTGGSSTDSPPCPKTALKSMMPAGGASTTPPQTNAGELAVVVGIQAESGLPDVDLLILRLTKVDLTDLLGVVIDPPPDTSLMTILDSVKLKDVLLYWCDDAPGALLLPDGTKPNPGFKIHGEVDFWDKFDVWAELEIDDDGIKGLAYLSPIKIGDVLSITGAPPPENTVPSDVTTGGPWLEIDTSASGTSDSPYLAGSWDVKVFDIEEAVNITVDDQGFTFSLTNNDADVFHSDFVCTVSQDWTQLQVEVKGGLTGDVPLPELDGDPITLHLYTSFDVTLAVSADDGGAPAISMSGSFTFGSDTIGFSNLTVSISKFSDIPGAVLQAIKDHASSIFSEAINAAENLIEKYGDDALKFLKEVADKIKDTVYTLLHIHHDHSHHAAWLDNGNVVQGDGVNFYQIANNMRRLVPDAATLDDLVNRLHCTVVWCSGGEYYQGDSTKWPDPDSSDGSQLLVDSLPIDTLEVPSRMEGMIVNTPDDDRTYLIVSSLKSAPGKYSIQDSDAFNAAVSNATRPFKTTQSSAKDDINQIDDNTDLKRYCTIYACSNPDDPPPPGTQLYAFVDGVCYHIPDPTTLALMTSDFQQSIALPGLLTLYPESLEQYQDVTSFNAIPQGAGFVPLAQGDFVEVSGEAPVYWVDTTLNELRQFKNPQSVYNWNNGVYPAITFITATQLSTLNIGSDMPETPPNS